MEPDIYDFISKLKLKTIVEIGANDGTDTLKFRKMHKESRIVCFEPDPRNIELLKKAEIDKIIELYPFAVSDTNGAATFHLSDIDNQSSSGWSSSSLKKPERHLDLHPQVKFNKNIIVDTIALDTFEPLKDTEIDFIWMDVQGAEDLVLKGATETLKRTKYLHTEYSDSPLYTGQPNKKDIETILGHNWRVERTYGSAKYGGDILYKNVGIHAEINRVDRVYILNDSRIVSLHPVLIPVFKEVCSAFEYRNIPVKIVQSITDVDNDNSSLVFVGNTFHVEDPASELAKICPNATYCLWYWHDKDITPLKRGIHIYENMLSPSTDDRVTRLRKTPYNCPLLLRACESPEEIGKYGKAFVRDYFYSGAVYCQDWMDYVYKHFNGHGIYNATWDFNKYMTYDTRKEWYKYCFFALGFQGWENIANKHVSQRIYEGMAYGCIVLTNSDAAVEQTEGICVKVENAVDLVNKMNWFKQHPDEMDRRRQLGYEFVKRCGTNHYAIDQILKVINTFPEIK
jgi:FkbM family methyltransferase